MSSEYDVIIAGGGPGGSTTGGLLKKYRPDLKVLIAERERFPREHIGESQLPPIGAILEELGAWDEVERANFPVKIGGTYRWGRVPELWDFNFINPKDFEACTRPASYDGLRRATAFQVDRAIYDDILLRHAEKLGCEVRQQTAVKEVLHDDDRIEGFRLSTEEVVRGRYYVDASGYVGILRRALGIPVDCPTALKNIAIWDYWENTAWADTIGTGGTRIQVISVNFGWLWFIPLGPTRTSLGLVCPVAYYKQAGKTPGQLYDEAVGSSERIQGFLAGATRENRIRTTNDWSFVTERLTGPNWFLVGECAGFADPILSAGLTLTQVGAQELAYTLIALFENAHDAEWLKHHYQDNQQRRVRQHMRFAEFWYAVNGQFKELQEHCTTIAKESGLTLSARQAWDWIARGGFTNDVLGQAGVGGMDLTGVNQVTQRFFDEDLPWNANDKNLFRLRLEGAQHTKVPDYRRGKIIPVECYLRTGHRLAISGVTHILFLALQQAEDIASILQIARGILQANYPPSLHQVALQQMLQVLEVLVAEGWVEASLDPTRPKLTINSPREGEIIRTHAEDIQTGKRV
jgi:flavin-dependent dehydrogenase